jgi:putative aldouronate transport system substrate-binding protein
MRNPRCLLCVSALLLSLCLAGAYASGGAESKAAVADDNFSATGFPIVKSPVTIKMGIMKSPDHGDFKTMKVITDYEKKTNVHIDWVEIPQQNFLEKWNLLLTSGDYPDAFYGRGMENTSLDQIYGGSGIFVPLNELVEKYAPNVKKMFDTEPGSRAKCTVDGKLISLPKPTHNYHIQTEHKFYVHKGWLDKVGLKVPTTTDELYAVLKTFKTKDPNGNGKADEIPFSTFITGGYDGLDTLFGSWGAADNARNHLMIVDGKVLFVPTQEGYRQGLEYMQKLYAEGLLDQEIFTQTDQQLTAKGSGPNVVLGSFIRHIGDYTVGPDRFFDYAHVPALKGPEGKQMWTKIDYPRLWINTFVITNKNKLPRETIRWVDYVYTDQGSMEFNQGPENVTWKKNSDGTWEFIAPPKGVGANDWRNGNSPGGYSLAWESQSLYKTQKIANPRELDYIESTRLYEPLFPKEVYPNLSFTAAQNEALSTIRSSIYNYVNEMEGKFITGQQPLSKWGDYVQELQKMGLPKYLEIYQAAYTAFKAIK